MRRNSARLSVRRLAAASSSPAAAHKASADLRNSGRILVGHGELGFDRLRASDKQTHRFVLGQLLERWWVLAVGQAERRHHEFQLA
jgi:hypothetical protein